MGKGKPWTREEEEQLRELVKAGKSSRFIAKAMKKTRNSIHQKKLNLGLVEQQRLEKAASCCSSPLVLPKELPSVETVLKRLAAVMDSLDNPGLSKAEVMRLRTIIQAAAVYQVKLAEYLDYRGIEAKLIDLDEKYERLVRERRKDIKTH